MYVLSFSYIFFGLFNDFIVILSQTTNSETHLIQLNYSFNHN